MPTIARPVSLPSRIAAKIGPISKGLAKTQCNALKNRRDYHGRRRLLIWRVFVNAMNGTVTNASKKIEGQADGSNTIVWQRGYLNSLPGLAQLESLA